MKTKLSILSAVLLLISCETQEQKKFNEASWEYQTRKLEIEYLKSLKELDRQLFMMKTEAFLDSMEINNY